MPVCGRGQKDNFPRVIASLDKNFTQSPSKYCRLPVVILSEDVNIKSAGGGVRAMMENIHIRRC